MTGGTRRVAVITGASSGIGKAAAKTLAAAGWRIIGVGRDPGRSAAAANDIAAVADGGGVDMVIADLALMADVERAAHEISGLTDRIDALVNNAGGMANAKVVTPEGLEANFAGNHLGPFHLTNLLIPLLRRAAADGPAGEVRIVNTSSDASEMIPGLPFGNLLNLHNYSNGAAYCGSKLANVLHAKALAGRLAADGIVAHAFHPGSIDSNFITHAEASTQAYMHTLDLRPADEGADTLVWLVTSDEAGRSSGGYFYRRAPRTPNPLANDDVAVERLWSESEALVANAARR
jgi:NAD(P)-dependent dehydrogenase (short-subunit alcohol dehydrogenase family)